MEKTGIPNIRELHFEDGDKSIAISNPIAENQFFHWFKIKCYDGIFVENETNSD